MVQSIISVMQHDIHNEFIDNFMKKNMSYDSQEGTQDQIVDIILKEMIIERISTLMIFFGSGKTWHDVLHAWVVLILCSISLIKRHCFQCNT